MKDQYFNDLYYIGENIIIEGTTDETKCFFPFEYNGRKYFGCTTQDQVDGRPWCSSTEKYSNESLGYCDCKHNGNIVS